MELWKLLPLLLIGGLLSFMGSGFSRDGSGIDVSDTPSGTMADDLL